MTEPIIINGVDVSECENKRYSDDKLDIHHWLCDLSTLDNPYYCIDNPNCYYKQLKRKEQECVLLANQYNAVVEQNKQLQKELNKIKKKCRELTGD